MLGFGDEFLRGVGEGGGTGGVSANAKSQGLKGKNKYPSDLFDQMKNTNS